MSTTQTNNEHQPAGIADLYASRQDPQAAYICSRIEDQIAYYEKQSAKNKRLYHVLSALSIVATACIPVLSVFLDTAPGSEPLKAVITVLSSFATVVTSLLILFNAKELWAKYRNSASSLTSLLHQYYTGTNAFEGVEGDGAFRLLARLAEAHMSSENNSWSDLMKRDTKSTSQG